MYERKHLRSLSIRVKESRKFIQVITGPRQAGKTTLAEQLVNKIKIPYNFVSADAILPSNSIWIEQQYEAARIKLQTSGAKEFLLIIDEIQKIENWSEVVKKNWDADSRNKINLKLLLLGSSALLLQKGLTESLAGRFEIIKLPHWSFKEMHDAFGFSPAEYVYFGAYPGAAGLIKDEKRWKDYILNSIVETTISKDIIQLTSIQKPALLKNLFELSCKYAGEILSYTKMLGQLSDAGNTTTLAHYENLLNKTWMIAGIQKFSGSKVSAKLSIPKWISYNSAFVSVYSGLDFKQSTTDPETWGRRVEHSIGSCLLNQSRINSFDIFYWREGNDEVDFIIQKGKKAIPIEVKTAKAKNYKGITKFTGKYKAYKNILISSEGLEWQDFLQLEADELFN